MAEEDSEKLNVEEAQRRLNACLSAQYRSVLQYTLFSASMFGLEYQAFGDKLWDFGRRELDDARLLVEKIVSLGGDPTTETAPLAWTSTPEDAVDQIIESESELIEMLENAIEPTGRDGRSEALEHTLEHLIMRKQAQVDFLTRARRER